MKLPPKLRTILGVLSLLPGGLCAAEPAVTGAPPKKALPLPGELFTVEGRPAFLIVASNNLAPSARPWVWYAPTLPPYPGPEERWMFQQFLDAGISVAGLDVGESYGSPAGRTLFTALHSEMGRRGYSARPVLLGRSRGGLMTLNWAADHPEKVGGFAGIYPVCNLASYPGVAKAAPAFGLTADELQAQLAQYNPVDRLAPLAAARVSLFAIHGDVDKLVPLEANSGLMKERYTALGGSMELTVPPGQGHNMWTGFFQCRELVSFVKSHAGPGLTITSPLDFQVVQRSSKRKGVLNISGELAGLSNQPVVVEARLLTTNQPGAWRKLKVSRGRKAFDGQLDAPAGGWHRVEVRALVNGEPVAHAMVAHVGVGEVFVVAGQSNSANHGEERQRTRTGLVASFDGRRWRPADDPQPGASGAGGSFMPPFGDAMAEKFQVPVGLVACGVGATSVREWLPAGAKFPNPPTLTSHVRQLPGGDWESKGTVFQSFSNRLAQLGPRGFRAVLWHQGESDANQADPSRTLPGELYQSDMKVLIRASHQAAGWKAPWFVAQATYHVPGDEASPDIRAAQAALWKQRVALEGPDTDALKSPFRESGGKGVHFNDAGLREHARRWVEKVAPWLEKHL